MAEYMINDPEDLIVCPYNKVHMIRAKRMQYHILKCRKQHDATEFTACPFNARHEVYKMELRYHLATCPDRARIATTLAHDENRENVLKGCTDTPAYKHQNFEGENWEDEIPKNPRIGVDPEFFENRKILVFSTKEDTKRLTAREKRELYLRAKKDGEDEEKMTKLHKPHQPSEASAIHQQQQSCPSDIFQYAMKKMSSSQNMAFGRGQSFARGRALASSISDTTTSYPTLSLNNGHNGSVHPPLLVPSSAGHGRGKAIMPNMPRSLLTGGGPAWAEVASGPFGDHAGRNRSIVKIPSTIGHGSVADQHLRKNHLMQQTSQPSVLVSNSTHASLRLKTVHRQSPISAIGESHSRHEYTSDVMNTSFSPSSLDTSVAFRNCPSQAQPHAEVVNSSSHQSEDWYASDVLTCGKNDDLGKFEDVPSWVGGGYGSSQHLSSNFVGFKGSWADEVDNDCHPSYSAPGAYQCQPLSESSDFCDDGSSEVSQDSTSSFSESGNSEKSVKTLRKVRKLLRQIQFIEKKLDEGHVLSESEVTKLKRKDNLKLQEQELSNSGST